MSALYSSEQAQAETLEGTDNSSCATLLLPINANDCVCRFVVSRKAALEAIARFQLCEV